METLFRNGRRKVRKYKASCTRNSDGTFTLVARPADLKDIAHESETVTDELTINAEQLGILRLLTNPDPYWRSSDGRRTKLTKLNDDHLENIINYMYRRMSDIEVVGDERSIEKQCITHIWLYKLNTERDRRSSLPNEDDLFAEELDINVCDDSDDPVGVLDPHW